MRCFALVGAGLALVLAAMTFEQAFAINNLYSVEYVGSNGGQWSDPNAWKNVSLGTTGDAATILGRAGGSNGMNTHSLATTHARVATIPAGMTVNYHGNMIGDLRWNQGSTLIIEDGAVWQQVTDATFTENAWTTFDGTLILDGGTMRRTVAAPTQLNDGGGLWLIGSYREDENFARLGGPSKINIDMTNGGRLENDGQLWFGADDEHSVGVRTTVTINDGHIDLTGGTFTYQNSELFVTADLAFFYDYYKDATYTGMDTDPPPQPKNEEWEINFTGPGSITVDSAGIWVYEQDEFGIWNEGVAGPLSYQDLWDKGILKAHGLSGKTGVLPTAINGETTLTPANFNDYFTVSGTPGSDDYTLTSNVPEIQQVEYVGADGGQWYDANAWENTTTSAVGDAQTILGREGGNNGINDINFAASHARVVTIPANTTVNFDGDVNGFRWNRGSTLIIEEGAVWQQLADETYEENSWTVFDGKLIIDGGSMIRKEIAPSSNPDGYDGPGLWIFGSYRDDENLQRLGNSPRFEVEIKNGGYLENEGQLWFGADDEHSVNNRGTFTINNGTIDLSGGSQFTYQNSELFVAADLAFFFDYYKDATYTGMDTDPPPQPKNEEWAINFTGPGSITVDSAGIWVYEQDEFGIWNEGTAGPLSYEDLWNMGILQAFGLSGNTEIFPSGINGETTQVAANFSDYFMVTGTPGSDDYILTSLIEAAIVPGVDGDHNDDGTIDAADYVLWRKSPGSFGGDAGYDAWREGFGSSSPGAGGGGAVPEPAAMLLVLAGLVSLSWYRKR